VSTHIYRRKGSRYWQARLTRSDGSYHRVSTESPDEGEAQRIAELLQQELTDSEAPGGLLFSQAHERYIQAALLKPNTIRSYTSSYRTILKFLGDFTLSSLKTESIHHYIRNRIAKVSHARIKRDLSYLSSMYNWWCLQPDGPRDNPVRQLNRRQFGLRESKPRTKWLTEELFEHLLACAESPVYRAILILAVETGMRQSEILGLTRSEVDLRRRRVVLGNLSGARTKSSKSRIIPLTPRALEALSSTLMTHRADHVFRGSRLGLPMTRVNWWWPQLCTKAGITNFRFHDLRHTFTSWASQRGVEERVLQQLLGHSTRSLTHRYAHLRSEDLEQAIQKFTDGTLSDTHAEDRASDE